MTSPGFGRRPLLAAAALPALVCPARAQGAWPTQPVRIVIPFGPGSGTDVTLRLLAPKMTDFLGQPLVIENRPGAGSTIGTDMVAKAPPDGSVFVHATLSSTGIAAALYRRLPYDPLRDLAPIAATVFVPLVLAVTARGWDVGTAEQLIATLRASPDRYQFGSNGIGATGHLASANFVTRIGARALHVPYRSGAETITALVAGQIQFMHDITGLLLPHHQSGAARCLFVTSEQRSPVMPDVPTMKEAGVPEYPAYSWFGLFGPAGTPRPIQDRMAAAVQHALTDATIAERLAALGTPAMPGYGPDRFAAYVRAETALWGPLVRASGAEAD
ncbi:tripartite tricarboxylate transporter substrate binding protein [Roseomonas eburnea]|uniref:Tripartite tricarboxylate transporter substrate binding protein n=1 Tax=Neoroseomonas eburnea TaxID=1346889 RepID=A0A9X9XAY5_9PROT|nr:tripartite tricarboxylate transporter substrate binding protein [Neoroseomonas eburnea]MBR0680871.1 tripartite tricarboxylate transporter substrate binding protein [Neoroseomonas eburnea]